MTPWYSTTDPTVRVGAIVVSEPPGPLGLCLVVAISLSGDMLGTTDSDHCGSIWVVPLNDWSGFEADLTMAAWVKHGWHVVGAVAS